MFSQTLWYLLESSSVYGYFDFAWEADLLYSIKWTSHRTKDSVIRQTADWIEESVHSSNMRSEKASS